MIFNKTLKQCVPKKHSNPKPRNIVIYDDQFNKQFNVTECNTTGDFAIPGEPRYYFTCEYNENRFIQKINKLINLFYIKLTKLYYECTYIHNAQRIKHKKREVIDHDHSTSNTK